SISQRGGALGSTEHASFLSFFLCHVVLSLNTDDIMQPFTNFILIMFVGGVYSINPVETEKQVSVGDGVSLSCRYSSSNVFLYWYRQYPSSKLDLLLRITESGSVSGSPPPGFSARVENKRVDLSISSAKLSDSALYY
ncbi:hypothetical protein SRHO_G00019280, partial [Serrasalmus rhombeus]